MFAPVLATIVHAPPPTYAEFITTEGATEPTAPITIGEEDAWQWFTKSTEKEEVRPRVKIAGDPSLALKVLETGSMIA